MITVLLEQIIQLLKGWIDKFNDHAEAVEDSLTDLNNTASDIELNTDPIPDIRDNTRAIITPITQIKTNTDSIKTDVTPIKTDTGIIKNNANSIATSAGAAAAFAEDCATNTLNIVDKVTTIASDTTQIRADHVTLDNDLDKIYNAIKWSCINTIMTETESGASPLSFDTDLIEVIENINAELMFTQAGSGDPSPSNPRTITGYSTEDITINGTLVSIALGDTYYIGNLFIDNSGNVKLKTSFGAVLLNGTQSNTNFGVTIKPGFTQVSYIPYINIGIGNATFYSDKFKSVQGAPANLYEIGNSTVSRMFIAIDNTVTTAVEANAWFGSNNTLIIYPLATVQEITLSSITPINTIKGINTVITNSNGNIEVTYKESVKHYLDKQDN